MAASGSARHEDCTVNLAENLLHDNATAITTIPSSSHEHSPVPVPYAKIDRSNSTKSTVHLFLIPTTAMIPLIGLISWLACVPDKSHIFSSFTGAVIGGHLTQAQAKAIDFVTSALLAPVFMAGLNFVWFASARVCVVNEGSIAAVPLQSLATASQTTRGSYDPLSSWSLLMGRTWKLFTLALIVILSAVGNSSLSNIIAYEAFSETRSSAGSDYTLQILHEPILEELAGRPQAWFSDNQYNWSSAQLLQLAQNMSSLTSAVGVEDAVLDDGGGYMGANVTAASMDRLDASVTRLRDVPAFRLTATCAPASLYLFSADAGTQYTRFTITSYRNVSVPGIPATKNGTSDSTSSSDDTCSSMFNFIGGQSGALDDAVWDYAFPAFAHVPWCSNLFFMAYLANAVPEVVMNSDFGTMQPWRKLINVTFPNGRGSANVSAWALQCALYSQEGHANYSRREDLSWSMDGAPFFTEEKTPLPSWLAYWLSRTIGNWQAPVLGPIFFGSQSINYTSGEDGRPVAATPAKNATTVLHNIVYASGETMRMMYNVAALNAHQSNNNATKFPSYNVTGAVDQQFYRITYVPVLLMVGLLAVGLSGLLSTILMLSVRGTLSWRRFRQVDVVRLVVDAAGGLMMTQKEEEEEDGEEVRSIRNLATASDSEMQSWAGHYWVSYRRMFWGSGSESSEDAAEPKVAVRLLPMKNGSFRGWVRSLEVDDLYETDGSCRGRQLRRRDVKAT